MPSRSETIENLESCFTELEQLMATLEPGDWDVQSLCPAWTVRGAITHLAAVEHVLCGWLPTPDDNAPPFDQIENFINDAAGWSNEKLTAETKSILETRRSELAATSDADFEQASMTPVGPGTYHSFMDVRVFDFWVHQRDITTPLGLVTVDSGGAAESSLDQVHNSMGYIAGKKIGLPDGMSLAVRLTGGVTRDLFVAVEGRAAVVDQLDEPSIELISDSLTFMQLACGRIDPQAVIDGGRITWTGDAEWADKAARNLAFTM